MGENDNENAENGKNLLIIADSETDSDLLYATGFLVPDPLIYLELDGDKILLVSDLEYGRARAQARVDHVVSISPYEEELRERGTPVRPTAVLDLFLKERDIRDLVVPGSFPLGHAEPLRELGYELNVRQDPFFPQRTIKRADEVEAIHRCQQATEECMLFVIDRLKRSEIRGNGLVLASGEPQTSERLRREARRVLLDRGFLAKAIIIAGGDQGCDPHDDGSGPLPANRPIIIDIFPRSLETRYWGDMTRTVVRGQASAGVKKLYRDVLAAQETAFELLRPGAHGKDVHQAVIDSFDANGNPTEEREGRKVGFIHGTGHGVGLDIHEMPRIGKVGSPLEEGQVVTVEPGLYYPGTGGVRIEDLVVITGNGYRNLTTFPKELEI